MPKLVDYAGRFEFLRQAAHALVRDEGVGGLSRRAIAARLEMAPVTLRRLLDSAASLEALAADEVRRARREGWWTAASPNRPGSGPVELALHELRTVLPATPALEHDLVWWRLLLAQPSLSRRAATAGQEAAAARHHEDNEDWFAALDLADRRRVAEGTWQPRDAVEQERSEPVPDPIRHHVEEQEEIRSSAVDRALRRCEVAADDRAHHALLLDALLTGLALAHVRGRIDARSARDVVGRHLASLLPTPR